MTLRNPGVPTSLRRLLLAALLAGPATMALAQPPDSPTRQSLPNPTHVNLEQVQTAASRKSDSVVNQSKVKADLAQALVQAPAAEADEAAPAAVAANESTLTRLIWLALALSSLSLAGVGYLLIRPRPLATNAVPVAVPEPERSSSRSRRETIKWDEIKTYVQRELDKRLLALTPASRGGNDRDRRALSGPSRWQKQYLQYVNEPPIDLSFPAEAMTEQAGPYSIFAIEYNEEMPNQGTFTIVGNLASHVRNHHNVLEPVCEYVDYPDGSETRVVTVQPGEVRRRGKDWRVISPARVRFES